MNIVKEKYQYEGLLRLRYSGLLLLNLYDLMVYAINDLGAVPQDNFLCSSTIQDNIRFFNQVDGDEAIEEVAKVSNVYDNIIDFPEGFDTMVGERGITLSGGQKQRISIARAIIKDPCILIMDDSLSAVDTKTEEGILKNIKNVLKGRTGIMIAHRLSTIKNANKIQLVLLLF